MRIAVAAAVLVFLPGCVTIVRGTRQPVSFFSEPPGATIVVSGGKDKPAAATGVTPCTLQVKRGYGLVNYTATFAGETQAGEIQPKTNGGMAVLIGLEPLFSIIGFIVDLSTASHMDLPHEVHVTPEGSRLVWEAPKPSPPVDEEKPAVAAATSRPWFHSPQAE